MAQNFMQLYYGPNKSPGINGSNFDDPEFNRLYEEAQKTLDADVRTDLYRKMQEIVVRESPWNFRCSRLNYRLHQPWFFNYKHNDFTNKYFQFVRVDAAARADSLVVLNRPRLMPLALLAGLFVALLGATIYFARNTRRGW